MQSFDNLRHTDFHQKSGLCPLVKLFFKENTAASF